MSHRYIMTEGKRLWCRDCKRFVGPDLADELFLQDIYGQPWSLGWIWRRLTKRIRDPPGVPWDIVNWRPLNG